MSLVHPGCPWTVPSVSWLPSEELSRAGDTRGCHPLSLGSAWRPWCGAGQGQPVTATLARPGLRFGHGPCPHAVSPQCPGQRGQSDWGVQWKGHGLWVALAVLGPCPPPHRDPRAAPAGPHAGGGDGRAVHLSGPPRLSPPGAWGGRGLLFPSRQSLTSPCDAAGAAGPGAASCAGGRQGAHGHLRDNGEQGDPSGFTPRAAGDGDSTCEVCPCPPDFFLVPPSPSDPLLVLRITVRPSSCPLRSPSSCRAPHSLPRCRGVRVNRGRVAPCEPQNPKPHPRGAEGGGRSRGSGLDSTSAAPGGSPRGLRAPGSPSGGCGMPCGDPPVLCPVPPAGPGAAGAGIPGVSSPGIIPGVAVPPLPGAPAPVSPGLALAEPRTGGGGGSIPAPPRPRREGGAAAAASQQ